MTPGSIFDRVHFWLTLLIGVLFWVFFFVQISRAESEKHLEAVRWDVKEHKLVAIVSDGRIDPETKKYVPEKLTDYSIDMDAAVVDVNGDTLPFGHYEALLMQRVIDMVVQYAGESVMWFDAMKREKPKTVAKVR